MIVNGLENRSGNANMLIDSDSTVELGSMNRGNEAHKTLLEKTVSESDKNESQGW